MKTEGNRVQSILDELSTRVISRKNLAKENHKWAIYRADTAKDEKQVDKERRIAEKWKGEIAANERVELMLSGLLLRNSDV